MSEINKCKKIYKSFTYINVGHHVKLLCYFYLFIYYNYYKILFQIITNKSK